MVARRQAKIPSPGAVEVVPLATVNRTLVSIRRARETGALRSPTNEHQTRSCSIPGQNSRSHTNAPGGADGGSRSAEG